MQARQNIENELEFLVKEKKENHKALMKEQQRAKKSKERGRKFVERKRWLPALGDLNQSYAQKTTGKNRESISNKRKILKERLLSLRLPEIIKPSFSLTAKDIASKTIVSISGGQTGYGHKIISKDINLSVAGSEHLAVTGDNGSGKTTLLRAILNYPQIKKTGVWDMPRSEDISYLDQCYSSLVDTKTVLETLIDLSPEKPYVEIRDFLNDFLFRKNEEVNKQVSVLSGG
jgi:ATPase subunit of ABC transporter with duplicated ATPase domains